MGTIPTTHKSVNIQCFISSYRQLVTGKKDVQIYYIFPKYEKKILLFANFCVIL